MLGTKLMKNQKKICNRRYRKVAHRFGQVYQPRRIRREWADSREVSVEIRESRT
jgi:hypothetical protein